MGTANDDGTTGTPPAPAATGTPAPKTAEQVKLETALAAIKEKNTKELWAQAKAASKIRDAYKEIADSVGTLTIKGKVIARSRANLIALGEQELEANRAKAAYVASQIKDLNKRLAGERQLTEAQKKNTLKSIAARRKKLIDLKNEETQIERNVAAQNQQTLSLEDSVKAGEDLGKTLGSAFATKNAKNIAGFVAGAEQFGAAMATADGRSMLLTTTLKTGVFSIIGTLVGEVWALVTAFDSMSKGMRKGTLMSKELSDASAQLWQEDFRELGISADQVTEAMKGLYSSYSDFTRLTTTEQKKVESLALTFEAIGIKSATTIKGLQTATTGFGMSVTEADHAMRDIATHAEAIGLDVAQTTEKFAGMGAQLAKFGDPTRTFKELGNIMKVTGMEMEDILRITDKFDTFEGAATQAGKLNAALGGNFVNAMDLMMATDPAERFGMIRDSILDAGLSFEDMSYYQKKYFTEAAGLKDVSQLNMMLRGDLEANNAAMEAQAKELDEFKDVAQSLIPITETLMLAFKGAFEDIDTKELIAGVETIIGALKLLMPIVGGLVEYWNVWLPLLVALKIGLYAVGLAGVAASAPFLPWIIGIGLAIAAVAVLWNWLGPLVKAFFGFGEAVETAKGSMNDQNSLSFLQSLVATAKGFVDIGISIIKIISPFHQIIRIFEVVGGAISTAITGIANLFTALMDPTAADNIVKIAKAISAIPTDRNIQFATSMTAAAGAFETVATAPIAGSEAMAAATTGDRVAGMGGAGGGKGGKMEQRTYNINVIDKNGTVTDKHILKVVGRDIESTLRQQR